MNEPLFSAAYHSLCENLLAIRRSGDWKSEASDFDSYVKARYSLSKTRAKLFCNFAIFTKLCREAGMDLPETPDNVEPVLKLAQKRWLEVWELILAYAPDMRALNAQHCKSVMDHFGVLTNKRIPPHVLKGMRVRRASKVLAELGDGEQLVSEIGAKGLGKHWDESVRVVIDADQARMDAQ